TASSTTWCSTPSISCDQEGASRWPLRRKEQISCLRSATRASRCRPMRGPGCSRRGSSGPVSARSTTSASVSISAGWWPSRTTDPSRCARRPDGRRHSSPGCRWRRAAWPSIWSRRSAALGPLEQRDHLGELCIRSAPRLPDAISHVVVQREVTFAPAECGDGPGQLAADVARQRLDVAEDVDPFRGDAVLRLPAPSVHRLSSINLRMRQSARIPAVLPPRKQATAAAGESSQKKKSGGPAKDPPPGARGRGGYG